MKIYLTNMAGVTAPPIEVDEVLDIKENGESISITLLQNKQLKTFNQLEKINMEKTHAINAIR